MEEIHTFTNVFAIEYNAAFLNLRKVVYQIFPYKVKPQFPGAYEMITAGNQRHAPVPTGQMSGPDAR